MSAGRRPARFVRWLWLGRGFSARISRILLLPLSAVYAGVVELRAMGYRTGILTVRRLPMPAVAFGNLSVGGSGKTPLAAWAAARCLAAGCTPAILHRGYGNDEGDVHERLVPGAIVVANPDRLAGAREAAQRGARVAVLDDAFQRLDVARDVNVAIVATEQDRLPPWPLPAGPWREAPWALRRATLIVVTRKRARADEARRLAERLATRRPEVPVAVAHLALDHLTPLRGGDRKELSVLKGHQVLAVAGVADPESFAVQVRSTGATVRLTAFRDHHAYDAADVRGLLRQAVAADYLVVTEKDAVKLRGLWPEEGPEPLVAAQAVRWELNGDAVAAALDGLCAVCRDHLNQTNR